VKIRLHRARQALRTLIGQSLASGAVDTAQTRREAGLRAVHAAAH